MKLATTKTDNIPLLTCAGDSVRVSMTVRSGEFLVSIDPDGKTLCEGNHSFLRYKRELGEYGRKVGKIPMKVGKVGFLRTIQ